MSVPGAWDITLHTFKGLVMKQLLGFGSPPSSLQCQTLHSLLSLQLSCLWSVHVQLYPKVQPMSAPDAWDITLHTFKGLVMKQLVGFGSPPSSLQCQTLHSLLSLQLKCLRSVHVQLYPKVQPMSAPGAWDITLHTFKGSVMKQLVGFLLA